MTTSAELVITAQQLVEAAAPAVIRAEFHASIVSLVTAIIAIPVVYLGAKIAIKLFYYKKDEYEWGVRQYMGAGISLICAALVICIFGTIFGNDMWLGLFDPQSKVIHSLLRKAT